MLRERAAEEAAELVLFCGTVAEFFRCPSMRADYVRLLLRPAFQELRATAHRLNGEPARRGAPLGQPAPAGLI
jgi:hypothetical protein